MTDTKDFRPQGLATTACALAILVSSGGANAQSAHGTARTSATKVPAAATQQVALSRPSPEKSPRAHPGVSYSAGQLKIDAHDTTLSEILTNVAAAIEVTIDIPAGASREKMAVVELGPGPAREILMSLLDGSPFDYLIQDSDKDAEKIQSVLLLPRGKGGAPSTGNPPADVSSGTYARSTARSPKPEGGLPPLPPSGREDGAADLASVSPPPPGPDQSAAPPAAEPNATTRLALSATDQSGLARPGTLSPPQAMSPQSINQQLQSMYQQRMQMIQTTASAAGGTQGKQP